MKTTVSPLEGNKVKLSVEVDEDEFDKAISSAYRKIAREVRIPGFRPGKAPRKVLERRLGFQVGREHALSDALPEYYAQALVEQSYKVEDITTERHVGPGADLPHWNAPFLHLREKLKVVVELSITAIESAEIPLKTNLRRGIECGRHDQARHAGDRRI